MPLYSFKEHKPEIGEGCFIAPSADVIGQVKLGANSSLWYGVVARGDINQITVGENTNIQDLTMLHVIEDIPLIIGSGVSVGHNAILHACTVEDNCLIGMGAIVLDGAVIGKNSVVAAGSVVSPGKKFPGGSMIMGSPAKVVRELRPEELKGYGQHFNSYLESKNEFNNEEFVKRLD
ncbi:MAG: gamma carbonic anhydrase family protein [Halobacteriovorax sp.]|nr:gamma carbonic anhydrase family protein [Halobacteriovorax sp.]|tara:strand:- start:93502 stop:94032 length:531 start_codon:yes stop_codon:yes gene_type:complete